MVSGADRKSVDKQYAPRPRWRRLLPAPTRAASVAWDFEEKLFFWMSFVVTMAPEMQTQVLSERWTHLPTFLRLTICPRHPEKTRPKVVGNGPHHRAGIP